MDIVINYRNSYEERMRDLGTFRYVLRSIETNVSDYDNIFLIYDGNIDNLPEWLNKNNLTLISHSDIIDEEYLPTFNEHIIEMNMHKINGLSNEFLYVKENTFFINPCGVSSFFSGNSIVQNFKEGYNYSDPENIERENFYSGIMSVYKYRIEEPQNNGGGDYGNEEGEGACFVPEIGANPMLKSFNSVVCNDMDFIIKEVNGMYKKKTDIAYQVFLTGLGHSGRTVEWTKRTFFYLNDYTAAQLESELQNKMTESAIYSFEETGIRDKDKLDALSGVLVNFLEGLFRQKSMFES